MDLNAIRIWIFEYLFIGVVEMQNELQEQIDGLI